jgi:hypothetical protein
MKTKFTFLLWFALLLCTVHSFSQETVFVSAELTQNEEGWSICYQNEQIEISYQNIICPIDNELQFHYLLFKASNTSDNKIDLSWEFKLYNHEKELMKSPDEMMISLSLEKKSSVEASCNLREEQPLRILISELSGPAIVTKAELFNISINPR